MADVSKDKLRKEITAILKNADLLKMSAKKVRQQLEEKLEVDLTDQKKVVDDLVMEFMKEKRVVGKKKKDQSEDDDEEDGEENGGAGEDEDDEEDDKKKGKKEKKGDEGEEDEEEDSEKDKRKAYKRSAQKNNKGSESDDGSDDDDEEEYGAKKKVKTTAKKSASKKKKKGSENDSDEDWGKNKKKGGRKGAKGGYTKPYNLSPDLVKLVGKETMPRHEVVKKIWAIIKERNLYDPKNKQFAICDSDLLKVIGVERFRIFGMMKYLKHHFIS